MKKYLNLPIVLLFFTGACFAVQQAVPQQGPTALTIIIDTSWSCEQDMGDFKTLSRQAIINLNPGDYLEVIAAQAGRPKIRVAETIKSSDIEQIKSMTEIVKAIPSYFLSEASVSNALEMALQRLHKTSSPGRYEHAVVIIFSDGKLSDSDTKRVLDICTEFKRKGLSLYLTGSKDTNKKLLIAANQRKIKWSLITDANPADWLRDLRQAPGEDKKQAILPVAPTKEKPTSPQEQTEEPKPKAIEQRKAQDEGIIGAEQTMVEDEGQPTEPSQERPVESENKKDKLEVRTVVDSTVSIAHP